LWDCLIRSGYIRFGAEPGGDYGSDCFDLSARNKNRDCRIVKIDHEEILCNNRIKVVAELANGFQQLVENTIELAKNSDKSPRLALKVMNLSVSAHETLVTISVTFRCVPSMRMLRFLSHQKFAFTEG